ncbi:MAG: MATE family efflux transporter [Paludibacteraceae bacterium]|nr:MATE family efflux transporter [Paludibacteraceae bacterium]
MSLPLTLGKEPIPKLLKQYAIPAIVAMTASSLYNMVDSIFIGHGVGALAISGLAVTFPFMNLAAAFGAMVGVGASTLLSVKLGAKDYGEAKKIVGNVIALNVVIGSVFMLVSLLFLDPILYFFGASEHTINYARNYMQIILIGNIITHLYLGLNSVIRSSGHPHQAMLATILTVILNAILDPIFIFVFDWGIRGAAVATILSQIFALIWVLFILTSKNEVIRLDRHFFRLDLRIVKDSLSIGLSPFLMNVASCFIVILINNGLQRYSGDLAIGAFGIVNRVIFVIIMIVMGLNQGMQPIAGFNYGANQMNRVMEVFALTVKCATVITTLGFLMGEFFPKQIASIFTTDQELIEHAVYGLRLAVAVFPFVGFQMVASNFFQSIGMAHKAIFLSLTRQLIFLIPMLVVLPHFFGVTGVWISMPLSDTAATIVSAIMIISYIRKEKGKL